MTHQDLDDLKQMVLEMKVNLDSLLNSRVYSNIVIMSNTLKVPPLQDALSWTMLSPVCANICIWGVQDVWA